MPRVKLTFRQRDVVAAIKAVERAGHTVSRVSISQDGSINVFLAGAGNGAQPDTPLDEWLRKHAHETEGG